MHVVKRTGSRRGGGGGVEPGGPKWREKAGRGGGGGVGGYLPVSPYFSFNLKPEQFSISYQYLSITDPYNVRMYRLHTAILDRPPSSAATMEVQGPDTQ